MPRKRRHASLHDDARPHGRVVTNLLAVQARLRGDVVVPVHPSARIAPLASGHVTVVDEDLAIVVEEPEVRLADVIALPGASKVPVINAGAATELTLAVARLEALHARLETLRDELQALTVRLERLQGHDAPAAGESPGAAIVRLQRAIDLRLTTR